MAGFVITLCAIFACLSTRLENNAPVCRHPDESDLTGYGLGIDWNRVTAVDASIPMHYKL